MAVANNHISAYFKDAFRPIFLLSRCIGLMPYYYHQDKGKHVQKFNFSPVFAVLGCIFHCIFAGLVMRSIAKDCVDGGRFTLKIDQYMAVADQSLIVLCLTTTTIIIITRRHIMLTFVNHLTQVDDVLMLTDASKSYRYTVKLSVLASVAMILSVCFVIYLSVTYLSKITHRDINYIYFVPYYGSTYIIVISSVLYASFAYGLCQRLAALSQQLMPLLDTPYDDSNDNAPMVVKRGHQFVESTKWRTHAHTSQHLVNIMRLYEHLIEALRLFNKMFGTTIFILLVSILVNLIVRPYFVIYQIFAEDPIVVVQLIHCFWLLFHVGRLILIVEPAQRLTNKLDAIREVVRKLLSIKSATNDEHQRKNMMEVFAKKILLLSTDAFTPSGMFSLTRSAYTSVMGTVIIYIVMIMNFKQ